MKGQPPPVNCALIITDITRLAAMCINHMCCAVQLPGWCIVGWCIAGSMRRAIHRLVNLSAELCSSLNMMKLSSGVDRSRVSASLACIAAAIVFQIMRLRCIKRTLGVWQRVPVDLKTELGMVCRHNRLITAQAPCLATLHVQYEIAC